MDYELTEATESLLRQIWAKNLAANPGDARWVSWREEALANNRSGRSKTFLALFRGEPVGEGTLLFSPDCSAIRGRTALADGLTVANINALRIEKAHEGKGHISALVAMMERYALSRGIQTLTIGVEAAQTRNLAIYLHWGYSAFVHAEMEENELVLYYAKRLKSSR